MLFSRTPSPNKPWTSLSTLRPLSLSSHLDLLPSSSTETTTPNEDYDDDSDDEGYSGYDDFDSEDDEDDDEEGDDDDEDESDDEVSQQIAQAALKRKAAAAGQNPQKKPKQKWAFYS